MFVNPTFGSDGVKHNAGTEPLDVQFGNTTVTTNANEIQDFIDYLGRRSNGTLNASGNAYGAITDAQERYLISYLNKQDDLTFIMSRGGVKDLFLKYFQEYRT